MPMKSFPLCQNYVPIIVMFCILVVCPSVTQTFLVTFFSCMNEILRKPFPSENRIFIYW